SNFFLFFYLKFFCYYFNLEKKNLFFERLKNGWFFNNEGKREEVFYLDEFFDIEEKKKEDLSSDAIIFKRFIKNGSNFRKFSLKKLTLSLKNKKLKSIFFNDKVNFFNNNNVLKSFFLFKLFPKKINKNIKLN